MARPGTQIISRDTPPPRGAPVATGNWFVAGFTTKGLTGAQLVRSMNDFVDKFGERPTLSNLYDAIETFFREGGTRAHVSRVVGDAVATAEVILEDGATDDSITVSANSPGAWGNDLSVAVTAGDAGGEFKLVISLDGTVVETSPSLVDVAAAVAWESSYVVVTDEGGADPAVIAAQDLVGGTDDSGAADDANWLAALDQFDADLGPGQVSAPGRTTSTGHEQLLEHAALRNRVALLDGPNTETVATLITAANGLKARDDARYGAMFAPWITVPGIAKGTTRTVAPSALVAGLISRNESLGLSANQPAAGENGLARWALDVTFSFTDAQREQLNEASVDVVRSLYSVVRVYGWRSLVDPLGDDEQWLQFSNCRLFMAVAASADSIAERYVFAAVDGKGRKLGQFGGDLTAMLLTYYERGDLYGDTPDEAFSVDVSEAVNPIEALANGEIRAVLAVRMSPFAELVTIEIVKVALTEAI